MQAAPSASRRLVTCVFCDLAESTALGDRADPEILRELMLGYYEQMQGVVERHGGRLEKFIGDAVAAVWGLSKTREDDAQRAVRAAVEMAKVAENLRPDFEAVAELGFAVRIGVNSGEVMIDPEDLARAAAVLGDAMNTAARLQTAAAHGEVVVGELTRGLAGGAIATDPPLELQLKGKAGVVLGYRVRSVSPLSPDRTAGRTSRMAGRRRELQTLDEALDEVIQTGACRLVLVTGEPGIGKSRLASEFAHRSGCTMLRGRCLSYGEGIAYWPLAEIVRAAADIDPSTRPEDARSRIHALVDSDPDADRLSAVIGEITGLERAASAASEITWATHRLFRHLAGERLVVCIDDLQWSEEPLRELLLSLPRALTDVPLLVLCLARPEVIDRDTHWPRHVRVEPLESDAAGVLIQELRPDLSPELVRNIADRSGGNPLFAEELVATLARQPTSTDPSEDLAVMPDSLRGLVGARLDMLAPSARAVAACGAVEGEVFHDGAVRAMTPASQRPGVG